MPIILVILGAVTTVAGLLLVGASLRDGTFQTDILTPGTIAAVGGLLLIAFGLAVREMRRIERAFAARPAGMSTRSDVPAATVAPASTFASSDPRHEPPLLPATPVAAEVQPDHAMVERLRAKIPTIPRADNGRLSETGELAQVLSDNAVFDESSAEVKGLSAVARAANGTGSSVRAVPRADLKPRLTVAPDKAAEKVAVNAPVKAKVPVFNSFWPAGSRGDNEAPKGAAPARSAQEPRVVAEPPPVGGMPASPPAASASAPVSVLKSGVVEGMAYTLYSDGSIEAQLPQGTLRFGSISALRSHIENNP
jgi:hypothetical protein